MQKSIATGASPTRPVPASTPRRSIVVCKGPALIAGADPRSLLGQGIRLIAFLLLLTACHSNRQATETLSLSQRRQRQLSYCDTLWQQLSLQLDGLTLVWPEDADDMPRSKSVRLTAEHGVMHLQSQKKTEKKTLVVCTDTVGMANHSEQSATFVSTRDGEIRKGKCLIVGLFLGLLSMVLLVYWKRKA